MNIADINSAIMRSNFTSDELVSIVDAVKFARSQLGKRVKYSLKPGDTVSFTSSRSGRLITGTVTNVAIKFVTVSTSEGLWRVPASMLQKV